LQFGSGYAEFNAAVLCAQQQMETNAYVVKVKDYDNEEYSTASSSWLNNISP